MPSDIAASVTPLDLQVAHHVERALAVRTDLVRERHRNVVEDQLRGERGAHAELVLPLLAERETGHALLDQERRDRLRRGGGVDDEAVAEFGVGDAAVGDEGLGAGETEDVAVAARAGLQREHVGADGRLGHAQAADPLAARGARQHVLALQLAAVHREVVREQDRVCEHRQREARVRAGERFADLHGRHRVESGAAVFLGNRDAQEAHLARAAEQRVVEAFGAIVCGGLRFDLARDELAQRVAQQCVLGRRRKQVEGAFVAGLMQGKQSSRA